MVDRILKTGLTMKCLNFLKEPFEPTAIEPRVGQLFESAALVDARVERELSAFYYPKDDGVFESNKHIPDPVEAEGILASVHEVLLHDGQNCAQVSLYVRGKVS